MYIVFIYCVRVSRFNISLFVINISCSSMVVMLCVYCVAYVPVIACMNEKTQSISILYLFNSFVVNDTVLTLASGVMKGLTVMLFIDGLLMFVV